MILNLLLSLTVCFAQPTNRFVNTATQGVVEVSKLESYSRVIAIGDINGHFVQFFNLLVGTQLLTPEGIWKGGKSLVVFTGNLIGTGPQSIAVIDLILSISRQAELSGGRVISILGNEELKLLANPKEYKNPALEKELFERRMRIEHLVNPLFPRAQFLRSLALAVKAGSWLFMHEGYYPSVLWDQFKMTSNMLLFRGFYEHELLVGSQGIYKFNDWWKDREKRNILKQRLIANSLFGMVFAGKDETFNSPGEIGISDEQRFIKLNTTQTGPTRILVFMNPDKLEFNGPAKAVSVAPGFIIKPLN